MITRNEKMDFCPGEAVIFVDKQHKLRNTFGTPEFKDKVLRVFIFEPLETINY